MDPVPARIPSPSGNPSACCFIGDIEQQIILQAGRIEFPMPYGVSSNILMFWP